MTARPRLVAVRGAGDLATGIAFRLWRAGVPVVMSEIAAPTAVRLAVSLARAVYDGEAEVEGLKGIRVETVARARAALRRGVVPVVIDPKGAALRALEPDVWVDAVMAKRNTGTCRDDARLVVALGPGFEASVDCHAVIETQRGHRLGRVIWRGSAAPASHVPDAVLGRTTERVLRAPAEGPLVARRRIGDLLGAGEVVAEVSGWPIVAPFAGTLRGLARDGLVVRPGQKVGDLDPRGVRDYCFTISDKALAVAGGVLEALLAGSPPLRAGGWHR